MITYENTNKWLNLSQTKLWIIESLFQLMKKKEFEKISVKEITDKAGIARRTFYLNYESKEEIVYSYVYYIFNDFKKQFILYAFRYLQISR